MSDSRNPPPLLHLASSASLIHGSIETYSNKDPYENRSLTSSVTTRDNRWAVFEGDESPPSLYSIDLLRANLTEMESKSAPQLDDHSHVTFFTLGYPLNDDQERFLIFRAIYDEPDIRLQCARVHVSTEGQVDWLIGEWTTIERFAKDHFPRYTLFGRDRIWLLFADAIRTLSIRRDGFVEEEAKTGVQIRSAETDRSTWWQYRKWLNCPSDHARFYGFRANLFMDVSYSFHVHSRRTLDAWSGKVGCIEMGTGLFKCVPLKNSLVACLNRVEGEGDDSQGAMDAQAHYRGEGVWRSSRFYFHLTRRPLHGASTQSPGDFFMLLDMDTRFWTAIRIEGFAAETSHNKLRMLVTDQDVMVIMRFYNEDGETRANLKRSADGRVRNASGRVEMRRIPLRTPESLRVLTQLAFRCTRGEDPKFARLLRHFDKTLFKSKQA